MKRTWVSSFVLFALLAGLALAQYTTKIQREADKITVASAGEIEVQSGAALDLQAGAVCNWGADIATTGGVSGAAGSFSGALTGLRSIVEVTTNTTLTAAQLRNTMIVAKTIEDDSTLTLTIPTLVAGYDAIFADYDTTEHANLKIQMGTGDKINNGTAAKSYVHGNGETAEGVAHFVSIDATDFKLTETPVDSGNWRNVN